MKIEGNCIHFKSNPECFIKEKRGSKPNTVRVLNEKDRLAVQAVLNTLERISISNTYTGKSFERELTDITHFDLIMDIWIFSWKMYKLIDD